MGRFKDLETEICNMSFSGFSNYEIADFLHIDVSMVDDVIDPVPEDIRAYAEQAADLDADFYGRN